MNPPKVVPKNHIQVQKERGNFVVEVTAKKCTKKRDARARLLFWLLNLVLFWRPRCRCRRRRRRRRWILTVSLWKNRKLAFTIKNLTGHFLFTGQFKINFRSIHTELWTVRRLNFRTVTVDPCEQNTWTHEFSTGLKLVRRSVNVAFLNIWRRVRHKES